MALDEDVIAEIIYLRHIVHVPAEHVAVALGVSVVTVNNYTMIRVDPKPKTCGSPTCERAGELLPVCDFNKNRANKDGLNSYCRECQDIKRGEWTVRVMNDFDDYEDAIIRDPFDSYTHFCSTCGMGCNMSGKSFKSYAEADKCCPREAKGDSRRQYAHRIYGGEDMQYKTVFELNKKYSARTTRMPTWR